MTVRWRHHVRVTRRRVIGLAVLWLLAGVCAVGAFWRASWITNRLLRDWATETIAQQSGGVYQLDIGRVRFNWALRSVAVDSIHIATRRTLNTRRPQPLPGLRLALYGCAIGGVHVVRLALSAGLSAGSFGCRSGSLMVEMPRRVRIGGAGNSTLPPAGHAFGERQSFLVVQQGLRLPSYAPRIRIAQVLFPMLALDIRLPRTASGVIRFELGRLQWNMTDVVIDPTDTTASARPLFSRMIELAAADFTTHPDRRTAIRVGLLRTSLTDSTLEVRGVEFAPNGSGAEFSRSRRHRHDLIRLTVGRITALGIDFGAFFVGGGVRARRIEVDSFRINLTSDKRLPKGPPGPPHRTPQQWIADLDETLSLDSLLVRNGELVYQEHAAERAHPGVLTFAGIEAAGANVSHFVGGQPSGGRDPMTLTASAQFQHAGRLDVRVVMPLDAARFNMTLRGTLGAMPARELNAFLVETQALQIESGQVAGVAFSVNVRNGVASGTITPRFNNLSLSVTRSGSGGILGGGGFLGGTARHFASLAAGVMLRADNPDGPADAPRIGTIGSTFTSDQTLVEFLWTSLRDGLLMVLKK